MHTFTYVPDPENPYDHVSVTLSTNTSSLPDLLYALERYLKATGFHFVGNLDIVEDETPKDPDQI